MAVRIDLEHSTESDRDSATVSEFQLLHLCGNLLVLDSVRNVWRFSHLSVVEYFEDSH